MTELQMPWDWHPRLSGASSVAGVGLAHATFMTTRRKKKVWSSDLELRPAVNHGRWVSPCPHCGGGAITIPKEPIAWCFGCGATFGRVLWPTDLDDIIAVLELRPADVTQNWHLGETVQELVQQNLEHGVPVP